jgi:hypothetical protein
MRQYIFHRGDSFYPIELKDDTDATTNAKANPGTTMVTTLNGKMIWACDEIKAGLLGTFKSRVETLDALYRRFTKELEKMEPGFAVRFSNTMVDTLLFAIDEALKVNGENDADNIIGTALRVV